MFYVRLYLVGSDFSGDLLYNKENVGEFEEENEYTREVGLVECDYFDRTAEELLMSIAYIDLGSSSVRSLVENLAVEAYRLGFKHGTEGLPPNIAADKEALPIILNDPHRPDW